MHFKKNLKWSLICGVLVLISLVLLDKVVGKFFVLSSQLAQVRYIFFINVILCFILLLGSLIVYNLLRRWSIKYIKSEYPKRYFSAVLVAIKKPGLLALFSYAAYFLIAPFLRLIVDTASLPAVRIFLSDVLAFCQLLAIFWFIVYAIKLLKHVAQHWANLQQNKLAIILIPIIARISAVIVTLTLLNLTLALFVVPPPYSIYVEKLIRIFLISTFAWLCFQFINAFTQTLLSRYQVTDTDNLAARKASTQIQVFRKVAIILIGMIATAAILMTFDAVRTLGASILTSAGVAGIAAGIAGRRWLESVLAGLQIAIVQPIRLDDAVIVENEYGNIEEITLTYVVVRTWDLRRLILPINYFIEKPFQNWTRHSTNLLGIIFLYMDYSVPIDELRLELKRVLDESQLWDGKVSVVQVSDAKPDVIEIRILASAENAPKTWDLRCEIREKMIDFIQKNYPGSLPKVRTDMTLPDK